VSIRKVQFLKKADVGFRRNGRHPWPDVAKLSSLGCSFSNQDALLPEEGLLPLVVWSYQALANRILASTSKL
jgi:hypothetical protein